MAIKDASGRAIHVGDRVRVIGKFCGRSLPLRCGTVRQCKGVNFNPLCYWEIGVEFDEHMNGHDLDGACPDGYGRWGYGREVEIIDEPVSAAGIKFQFEDIFG